MKKFSKKHNEIKNGYKKNKNLHLAILVILVSIFIILSVSALLFAMSI